MEAGIVARWRKMTGWVIWGNSDGVVMGGASHVRVHAVTGGGMCNGTHGATDHMLVLLLQGGYSLSH